MIEHDSPVEKAMGPHEELLISLRIVLRDASHTIRDIERVPHPSRVEGSPTSLRWSRRIAFGIPVATTPCPCVVSSRIGSSCGFMGNLLRVLGNF